MRGVGRDEEDRFAVFGELYGERARRGCLSDTTFAADEYPAQRLLVEDGLERGLHDVVVGIEYYSVRHSREGRWRVSGGLVYAVRSLELDRDAVHLCRRGRFAKVRAASRAQKSFYAGIEGRRGDLVQDDYL